MNTGELYSLHSQASPLTHLIANGLTAVLLHASISALCPLKALPVCFYIPAFETRCFLEPAQPLPPLACLLAPSCDISCALASLAPLR